MTTTDVLEEQAPTEHLPLRAPQLPGFAPLLVAAIALALGGLSMLLIGAGVVLAAMITWVAFFVGLTVWSSVVEGQRKAVDRIAATLIWSTFLIAVIPLIAVSWEVIAQGHDVVTKSYFWTDDMVGILGDEHVLTGEKGGGIKHALIGTLMITVTATVISVPIGVMAGIYLVEYGKNNRLAKTITFLVDVMTGIPSIVAGLFAFALLTLILSPDHRSGLGGAVALSVLMVPIVVRSTEEMLKLVPDELREASYALGVPKWRTIVKVVLPTAFGGIATGVTLAVARVAGETAPLLIIAGTALTTNWNVFGDRMMTLPVYIFSGLTQGGKYPDIQEERAWGAALVLVAIVMMLNLLARLLGKIFSPKTGR